ncbi:hypothetical protein EUCA11A_10880 [Eubacterium callanderi]|uniref:hypothetical protein n=1 Tax=Eubacterium callanderi TaxID=53442 RepID=UPI0029FED5AE|nr:hypothetical protein [Eubacterium callanderi]WPK66935.1 hypothetical protein EUCA2A_10880 [Eubacterium callanderi]WPK71233.1 hypothetical protein EUCA11A_10880 [Eubacterium callanderi]
MLKINEKRTIELTGVTEVELGQNTGAVQIMNREAKITNTGGLTYNTYELNQEAIKENADTVKAETAEFLQKITVLLTGADNNGGQA